MIDKKFSIIGAIAGVALVSGLVVSGVFDRTPGPTSPDPVSVQRPAKPVVTAPIIETPTDRSGGGDYGLLRDDFAIDPKYSVRAVGQNIEMMTSEGYRVSLILPPNNTLAQDVTVSALQKNPFGIAGFTGLKGTGISVLPKYTGLSGRPFYDPAWLVFDFSPEKRTYDKKNARDFCRPDYTSFDVVRCINARGELISHDSLFVARVDTGGRMKASLVPVFKIGDDVYAVAVLYEGVYAPFVADASMKDKIVALSEMHVPERIGEASSLLEMLRAFEYFGAKPGTGLAPLLADLPNAQYIGPLWQLLGVHYANMYGVTGMESVQKRLEFSRVSQSDWTEYLAASTLMKRSYPKSTVMPDLLSVDVQNKFMAQLNRKPPTGSGKARFYADRLRVADAFSELWQWYTWAKKNNTLSVREDRSRLTALREWFAPTVSAQIDKSDPNWPEEAHRKVGEAIQELIDQTGCGDFDGLLMIASIAFEYEHEELGNAALDKAKGCLADAIAAAPAGGGGGSGGGDGGGNNDGGSSGCDLVHKDLSNYGINSCNGGGTLVDLAKKAFQIEEDDLGNQALQKAGLLN